MGGNWRSVATVLHCVCASVPSMAQGLGGETPSVSMVVTQTSTEKAGYETYHVGVMFGPLATDVYALYGQKDTPLIMPPAYQVAAPFGSSVGPVNQAFAAVQPDCAFDSWLTIGIDGPALIPNALSSVGLPLDDWSESQGINADNGAVFFMDPAHGATTEPVVFAQLTVRAGTTFSGQVSAQGRSTEGTPDWDVTALPFSNSRADAAGAADAMEMAMAAGPTGAKDAPPPPPQAQSLNGAASSAIAFRPVGGRVSGARPEGMHEDGDEPDCTVRGLSGVSSSCPPAAAGSAVPSSCPTDCAAIVNSWYQSCMASRSGAASVQRLDHMLSGDLMTLVTLCSPAGGGGH